MARPRLADKEANQIERSLYTRVEAAQLIGVHRDQLRNYEELAIFACKPFREMVRKDGVTETRKPLTAYQVWVLGKIRMMYRKIPRGCEGTSEITRFLKNNPHKLDQEAYRNELSQQLNTTQGAA
jgi:hypothetical protein